MKKVSLFLLLMVTGILFPLSASAVEPISQPSSLGNASVLASVATTNERSTIADGTHYFTMTLPKATTNQFAKISFSFTGNNRQQTVAPIHFDLSSTKAFIGVPGKTARAVELDGAWVDETGTLWVGFKQPISSKTTITVALKTKASPKAVYEYGIAAYPATEKPVPVFVGDGTLTIR